MIDYATLRRLDLKLTYNPFDRVAQATVCKREGGGITVIIADQDEEVAATAAIARYVKEETEGG